MVTAPTSHITFLYFSDLTQAKSFFTHVLELEVVNDQGWACIFRAGERSFIGAVDANRGSIEARQRGGVLISLNVDDVDGWHQRLKAKNVTALTEIKHFTDINLRSFFFKGPDGYDFEIQQFLDPSVRMLF